MRVNAKSENPVALMNLDEGDTFWWDSDLHILTDEKDSEDETQHLVVRLVDGAIMRLSPATEVIEVDAEVRA